MKRERKAKGFMQQFGESCARKSNTFLCENMVSLMLMLLKLSGTLRIVHPHSVFWESETTQVVKIEKLAVRFSVCLKAALMEAESVPFNL